MLIRVFLIGIAISLFGCQPLNVIKNLKPGQTRTLNDFRHEDLTFSCDVTKDAKKVLVINSSSHQLFQDAWRDLETARADYQMRNVKVTGKVSLISGGWHIGMIVGEPVFDTVTGEGFLVEAYIELEDTPNTLMGKTLTYEGRLVFIERWDRIHIDNARRVNR